MSMTSATSPATGATRAEASRSASTVARVLVVCADSGAREASEWYLRLASRWNDRVRELAGELDGPAGPCSRLLEAPGDLGVFRGAVAFLTARLDAGDPAARRLVEAAWQADCNSRVALHLGKRYTADGGPEVTIEEIRTLPVQASVLEAGRAAAPEGRSAARIVIPFRDRSEGGSERLRNLLACLKALGDQSLDRGAYRIVVIETDSEPRWREVIEPLCDDYLFACKPGPFNKSWAVNAATVHTRGGGDLVCVLDGDVLVDRDFVRRNVDRFGPGVGALFPFQDMLYLDRPSTYRSIRSRCAQGEQSLSWDELRGFYLRGLRGCCVWVRQESFDTVNGMDERYEGWGGEDNDFAYRLDARVSVCFHGDRMAHMYHPTSAVLLADGQTSNSEIPAMSWPREGEIGVLDKFGPQPAPPALR